MKQFANIITIKKMIITINIWDRWVIEVYMMEIIVPIIEVMIITIMIMIITITIMIMMIKIMIITIIVTIMIHSGEGWVEVEEASWADSCTGLGPSRVTLIIFTEIIEFIHSHIWKSGPHWYPL